MRLPRFLKSFVVNRQPGQELDRMTGSTYSGVSVSEETALNFSAVWACVRLLSETVASLPLPVYRRLEGGGKERALDHPLYALLHDSPNPEMSAFHFREALQAHVMTWGNGYALIDWNQYLQPTALWLISPDRMVVTRDMETRDLIYSYTPNSGQPFRIPAYRMFHLAGLGFDGLMGYSVIQMARESIGYALAAREYSGRFFGQGTNTSGVFLHPKTLSAQAHENLKKDLKDKYEGLDKAHRIMVLEEGMTFSRTSIPPEDSQMLQTIQFSITDIARWFHIPPHMIGDLSRATFSNIEQQSLEFVVYTARPWLVRWEQSIKLKLITAPERSRYFAEFLVDGLLRGDYISRMQGYWTGIQAGIYSPNECREMENRNPREGGDEYLRPVNMVPANAPVPLPPQPPKQGGQNAE